MKKIYSFLLVTVGLLFINISCVKCLNDFPDKINVITKDRIYNDGQYLMYKDYTAEYNGKTSNGKAICSSMRNYVPSSIEREEYTQTAWHRDPETNLKIAAGVGSLINMYRDSNAAITNDDYYYIEIAINKFLTDSKLGGDANNVYGFINKTSLDKSNKYEKVINHFYNDFSSRGYDRNGNSVVDSITGQVTNKVYSEIKSVKVNGVEIKNNTEIAENSNGYYKLEIRYVCYEYTGKQVACDSVTQDIEINDESIWRENGVIDVKTGSDGLDYIITADITSNANSNSSNKVFTRVCNQRKYYLAQRYEPVDDKDLQTLTPNYLVEKYSGKRCSEDSRSFKIKKNVETCESQISNNPVNNANLYASHSNDTSYGNRLLDINNPSCDSFKPNVTSDCSRTKLDYSWVVGPNSTENHVTNPTNEYMLCRAQFSFNNNTLVLDEDNQSVVSAYPGGLIYSAPDGVFGSSTVKLECNIPSLYGNGINGTSFRADIETLIPNLSVRMFDKNIELDDNDVTLVSSRGNCVDNTSNITCTYSSESDKEESKNFGWLFILNVNYKYPDEYKNSSKYGILVPNNAKSGNIQMSFTSVNGTVFRSAYNGNIENDSTCKYEIKPNTFREEVLYRTIDYSNPFNSIEGNNRFTGSNWCDTSNGSSSEDIISKDDESVDDEINNCIYPGDINGNHKWDSDDVNLLSMAISNEDDYSNLYDVNGDGKFNTVDTTALQNIINDKTKYKKGDVDLNGTINTKDVELIQLYVGFQSRLNALQKKLAYLDNKCEVELDDATYLQILLTKNKTINDEDDVSYQADVSYGKDDYTAGYDNKSLNGSKECSVEGNKTIKKYITDRPNSNGVKGGTKVEPLYHFELTPQNIKSIRENSSLYTGTSKEEALGFIKSILDNEASSGLCKSDVQGGKSCEINESIWAN